MEVAVVILNWNGKPLLKQFLPSVVKYSKNATIYVIDNASTDGSRQWIQKHHPSVNIITNTQNKGFSGGYNEGLKNIQASYYLLLNSDVLVGQNWIAPLLETLKSNDQIAVVQPKIKSYRKPTHFEYAGAAGGFLDAFGYPYCRGRLFQTIEKDLGQYEYTDQLHWASGACLLIRSDVFHNLGGFDEDYFAYQEEIDFCWRLRRRGLKIAYNPQSEVYHLGGGTMNNNSPKKTFLNFRNSLYSLLKNLPRQALFVKIISRLILDGIAGIVFALQGHPKHTIAIVKAHLSFYSNLPTIYAKRTPHSHDSQYNIFSIVWHYFIRGKKHLQ